MTIERFTLISMAIFSIIPAFYIPKEKIRIALVAFLAYQAATWLIYIYVIETGNIAFPVREFVRATRAVFTPAFILSPMIFTLYIILFPKKDNFIFKLSHFILFVSIIVGANYFQVVYTDIIRILKGSLLTNVIDSYIRNIIQFALCHLYIKWFFKK